MNIVERRSGRRILGRVSTDTKGPPGLHMEGVGRWVGVGLSL